MGSLNKYAPVAGLALVVLVILIVVVAGREETPGALPQIGSTSQQIVPQASPVTPQNNAAAGQGAGNAPMLESLVAGLESKVKADPTNTNNQLLLAQTYAELGRQDDAVRVINGVRGQAGDDPRVKLVSAMVLSKAGSAEQLQESLELLKGLEDKPGAQVGQVILQRGKVLKKMGRVEEAQKTWRDGLGRLPEGDPVRAELEQALAGG